MMNLKIASPCSIPWDEMAGNDRVRYCTRCHLNVYNLAEMSPQEVEAIVLRSGGRLCGRLYTRGDQTVTLRRCRGGRPKSRIALMAGLGALLLLGAASWVLRTQARVDRSQFPPLVRQALQWIDPEPVPTPRKCFALGEIAFPAPAPPGQNSGAGPQQ